MIHRLLQTVRDCEPFGVLRDRCRPLAPGGTASVAGVAGSLDALILAALSAECGVPILVVAEDKPAADRLRDDLASAAGRDSVHLFLYEPHGADQSVDAANIQALRSLAATPPPILITHPPALLLPLPDAERVAARAFTVTAGEPLSFEEMLDRLRTLGFHRTDVVEGRGDYAVRGGIVDVFPFAGDNPVRLEFAGDVVESLREFEPLAQRSIRHLTAALIVADLPAGEEERPGMLLDHLPAGTFVVMTDPDRLVMALEEKALTISPARTPEQVLQGLKGFRKILFPPLHPGGEDVVDFASRPQTSFHASVALLRTDIAGLQSDGFSVVLACGSQSEAARLKDLFVVLEEEPGETRPFPDLSRLHFTLDAIHEGFVLPVARLAVYTEHQVFNRIRRRGERRRARFRGMSDREVQQLRRGDYVVHEDYGIGRFDSLQRISVRGVEQEVVKVMYEAHDTLYVNLNVLHKLQKYSSREGHLPRLTRLGSPDWDRLRARVKKRVKDIARELITLYARRRTLPGNAFPPDAPWQKELEASFLYEDTFDQARATLEVKQDMEQPYPMDRLVCGDVGFGKTEVAVRAAFKGVMAGKQVAVLVPTTILAMQHYNTFVDRTSRYGVQVRVLSRFKSKAEQSAMLQDLKDGRIDIIIGTHRLLSKDVGFRDLGLLIIDEEHRFGVRAKEHLRRMRAEVDTVTLTATPIPRTLHFSLLGARDLSIIATPPRNRLPIVTEVVQWDDAVIRDALQREIQRSGQVYVVHDRVQTIDEMLSRLQGILPGVQMRSAHGQMRPRELEEVMMGFLEKRFDVLVTTKIIESGLDIPNVNTIIINRADRFGMAELHQLRGRVGRSNIQAHAYLITPPFSVLPRGTLQRLQAVQEFTELGSGFNLAMRDLEIRGAGNLLGSEQSGFIEAMGFETYTRILDEAVRELKEQEFSELFAGEGEKTRRRQPTVVEPGVDAFIPDWYIDSDTDRLTMYRRLFAVETPAQLEEIRDELADRFGPFPDEVLNLFDAMRLRMAGAKLGFPRLVVAERRLEVDFPAEDDTRFYDGEMFQHLMKKVSSMKSEGAVLRQEGKTLRATFQLGFDNGRISHVRAALEVVESLQKSLP
jgi:transcription-repair coupling factor (superfamily II helicase)